MRITADFIDSFTNKNPFALISSEDEDEETPDFQVETTTSSKEPLKTETTCKLQSSKEPLKSETTCKLQSSKDPYLFCAIVGDKVIPLDDEVNYLLRQKYVKSCHNIMEMTQGFEKLSLFDEITKPVDESQKDTFHTTHIFVSNLPKNADRSKLSGSRLLDSRYNLRGMFEKYGKVEEWYMFQDFALVSMSSGEEAKAAIHALNNIDFMGNKITVKADPSKSDKLTADEVPATSQNISPSWLKQYLSKMKQEIKKEIVQELLHENEMSTLRAATSSHKMEDHHTLFQDVVHSGIFCDNCDQLITGIRYKCGNCSDFDLCQECESLPNVHDKYHIFLKIRFPLALKLYQKQKTLELLNSTSPTWKVGSGKLLMTSRNRSSKKLYEAKFVCDETVPDSTVIPPLTRFVKSWRVVNSGTRVWTHATKLQLIQGSEGLVPSSDQVDVPHLKPGEEGVISVVFMSPATPGVYRCHWNFCHKSRPFGDFVWCHIVVKFPEEDEKAKTPPCIAVDKAGEKQNEASCIAQVLTAVKKEHDRGNMVPRKLVVSSHTATPNNTPFDLTPPKSPDHHESSAIKSIQEINVSTQTKADSDDDDDECSIVSIGSSESDTEFVVIPMPKCFNLSESFVSQHIPMWVNCQEDTENSHKVNPAKQLATKPENTQVKKPSGSSEMVSQETGVPEFSENPCDQTVMTFSHVQMDNVKTSHVSLVTGDGSSSEVSIIESEENSPVTECATQTINLSLSSPGELLVERVEVLQQNNNTLSETVEESEEMTFPKFPIEGITATYDPSPASNEDSSVQVLPESLVTGALSAAASVYNTARAVISTIQQPRNEETSLSQDCPRQLSNFTLEPMDQLIEMGFGHRELNEKLLKKFKGNVAVVVSELVKMNDNDWYASRHANPPSPPTFD